MKKTLLALAFVGALMVSCKEKTEEKIDDAADAAATEMNETVDSAAAAMEATADTATAKVEAAAEEAKEEIKK